jgi:GxxExxY protein
MRDKKTFAIIGAAMEVHKELGSGFLEAVYQEAMEREFTYQEIPYKSQHPVRIEYKGKPLKKTYEPDFICYDGVIVEIKAMDKLSSNEHAQIINYLKASKIGIGLLINFGSPSLQHKRFVYSK